MIAHGRGPRIGQEIDQIVIRFKREKIVAGSVDQLFALVSCRHAKEFYGLDPEWLYYDVHWLFHYIVFRTLFPIILDNVFLSCLIGYIVETNCHYKYEIRIKIVNEFSVSDRKLLAAIQANSSLSQIELAEKSGMSRTSCWRRVRELERMGVIKNRVTLLDPKAAGLGLHVIVSVSVTSHTNEMRDAFEAHAQSLPDVMECFAVSGDWDYMLQVIAVDMDAYNSFLYDHILSHPSVRSASSSFALRRVKYSTVMPIPSVV